MYGWLPSINNLCTHHTYVALYTSPPHTYSIAVTVRLTVGTHESPVLPTAHRLVPDKSVVTPSASERTLP